MQEKQLQELLGSLSLTEKIGQLVQVPGEVPVSYTHLDVYKRQAYGSPVCLPGQTFSLF